MLRVPVIRARYHVEIVPPEGVYLVAEGAVTVLKGDRNCRLVALMNGVNSADDIVDALGEHYDPAELYYALDLMEQKGYAVEADPTLDPARAAFFDALGVDARAAEDRLARTAVALRAFGELATEPLARALRDAGVRVEAPADFTVVLVDDYLQPALGDVNAAALAAGRPWMLARPVGLVLWVGPVLVPGRTGCWQCLAHRLERNREVEAFLQRRTGKTGPFPVARARLASTAETAVQLVATEVVKWLARGAPADADATMFTFDTVSAEAERHVLIRRPQCAACGDRARGPAAPPAPVTLRPGLKRYVADGGHRVATPAETLARYRRHVSAITGAVSYLVPLAEGASELRHTYMAGHNFAMDTVNLPSLRKGLRSKSAGKGVTESQARASALCEAIERYSGLYTGEEFRVQASLRQLGESAIHPNACMLFSERQYATRVEWNARELNFHLVPDPLDEDAVLDWSPVWSLTRQAVRYLPTGYLYFAYARRPGQFFFAADSNGNAAGNSLEEAILQGFMELVERDGVAIWWYNRLGRPAVDLDSFELPYVRELRAEYGRLARELWVLDLTADLGIPVFGAISRRADKPVEDILLAFGAHFDPQIALLRALTELNQFLPAVLPIQADGSGEYAYPDAEAQAWWRTATIANQPYLLPDPAIPARRRADFPMRWSDDLREDILACQALVEARGLELLVLDQTRPDIGLPVAKVLVPGLRHFWARFAPGRLYDVPVRLGWTPHARPEPELNPIPLFV